MKSDYQEYKETDMLGSYHPEHAVLRRDKVGVETIFRDACHEITDGKIEVQRAMLIHGRDFLVTSVFTLEPTATPTDKLLHCIDHDLKAQ